MTSLCKKYPLLSPLQASFPFTLEKTNSTSNGILENENRLYYGPSPFFYVYAGFQ